MLGRPVGRPPTATTMLSVVIVRSCETSAAAGKTVTAVTRLMECITNHSAWDANLSFHIRDVHGVVVDQFPKRVDVVDPLLLHLGKSNYTSSEWHAQSMARHGRQHAHATQSGNPSSCHGCSPARRLAACSSRVLLGWGQCSNHTPSHLSVQCQGDPLHTATRDVRIQTQQQAAQRYRPTSNAPWCMSFLGMHPTFTQVPGITYLVRNGREITMRRVGESRAHLPSPKSCPVEMETQRPRRPQMHQALMPHVHMPGHHCHHQ